MKLFFTVVGLYSAALLEHQAAGTMTCYPTQSHYPDAERTGPCHIVIMSSARLGREKQVSILSHWFDSTMIRKCEVRIRIRDLQFPEWEADVLTHLATLIGSGN